MSVGVLLIWHSVQTNKILPTQHGHRVVSGTEYVFFLRRFNLNLFLHFPLVYVSEINGDNEKDAQCLSLETDQVKFCIFSLEFSNCGKYLIGGSSDGALYIYDRTISKQKHKVPVVCCTKHYCIMVLNNVICFFFVLHQCTSPEKDIIDVHSVGFIDETSNIIYTGLDDGCIKVFFV